MATLDRRTLLGAAAFTAFGAGLPGAALAAESPAAVRRLYREAVVIDGNLVAPFDPGKPLPAPLAAEVRRSGLTALKMTMGGDGQGAKDTAEQIAGVDSAIAANPDLFVKIATASDIPAAKRTGRIGIIYSFEAASMLEGRVDAIDRFRASGVLVMGLSYNLASPFASGVLAPPTGLTPLGREAVLRMNAQGVTVDLSHSDEPSSLAAIAASKRPVLITHAGCAAVHPHPRNKSDRLLHALAARGGVVGIYELSYLRSPSAQPSMDDYFAHLDHALKVCGEDHVGIGSDTLLTAFDTSPANMADWRKDIARRKAAGVGAPGEGPPPFVTGLNRSNRSEIIAQGLARRGYPMRTIEKVLGANFQRVFAETWTAAA